MSAINYLVIAYAVGGAVMYWFCRTLQNDTSSAYRFAVVWPCLVALAGAWLALSLGIILRERFSR